jgi:hypothetical protein
MDVGQTQELVRIVIAVAGTLSICWGYKLFCDRRSRSINVISGAFLALLGMGILTAAVHGIRSTPATQSAPAHKAKPAKTGNHKPSTDWLV